MRISLLKTPEHRSRELLNLVTWAARCAELPQVDEAERQWWHSEVRRAQHELWTLRPLRAPHAVDETLAS